MYSRWLRIIVLSAIVWSLCANSQSLHAQHRAYHLAQVVPGVGPQHTMISDASKDASGTIWIVSGGSLYRYNGVLIESFDKLYVGKLPFNEVVDVMADEWGHLWINSLNKLYIFDLRTWSFVDPSHRLYDLTKHPVLAYSKSADLLYVAGEDGRVWAIGPDSETSLFSFVPTAIRTRQPVGNFLVTDEDYVWLSYDDRLYAFDLKSVKKSVVDIPLKISQQIEDLLPVKGGLLMRTYSDGYYLYDGSAFRLLQREEFVNNDFTNWNHWSAIWNDRIITFHRGLLLEYSRDTAFTLLRSSHYNFDHQVLHNGLTKWQYGNNEWLLATNKGLFSLSPSTFEFGNIGLPSTRGMVKHKDIYYFGGYGYLQTGESHTDAEPYKQAPENNYYAFLTWSPDTVFIAMEGDFLNSLSNGKVSKSPIHIPPSTTEKFAGMAYSLARYTADTLLVGTSNGIWKYAVSTGRVMPYLDKDQFFFSRGLKIHSISVQDGHVSYASSQGFHVYYQDRGKAQKIYPQSDYKLNVYSHLYKGNHIYLATKGNGLVILDRSTNEHRSIRHEDGLANNTVYSMVFVDELLVMGTHQGLSIWDRGRIFNYYATDGLSFEEFNHQAVYYDAEYDLVFMGGIGGYTYFRPSDLIRSPGRSLPTPVLSDVRVGYRTNQYDNDYTWFYQGDAIHLSSDVALLSLGFVRPDSYRKTYQLYFKVSPLMKEFQEMPASAQINVSGLVAGEYQVLVKIRPLNSNEGEQIRSWTIYKKPAFTETFVFYLLLFLGISGILSYILYERYRKVIDEKQLRTKISHDLHDEVGGLLTGISMQTDLLRLKGNDTDSKSVELIADYSREAVQMMDDIIWTIDARNNQPDNLADRMKYIAAQLLEPKDILITFEMDQFEDQKINQTIRENLYFIFKEAIHNICKHAIAKNVYIKFRRVGKSIELVILDDGKPIKDEKNKDRRRGQGQFNMHLRAETIGATLTAGFKETGYEVAVTVPDQSNRWFSFF